MSMSAAVLEKPLDDLRREITDLRQVSNARDYDTSRLDRIMTLSRESFRETESCQEQLLQQLKQFEHAFADVNQILRAKIEEKVRLEQKQPRSDAEEMEVRAKFMSLNAEALECRAAAVQLQQNARFALAKATEMEKRASDELAEQERQTKAKQQEIERERVAELERRVRREEERLRVKELQKQQQERSLAAMKTSPQQTREDEYVHWTARDFMHDDHTPSCMVRLAPESGSVPIAVTYLDVAETEHLLDGHEELISAPMRINVVSPENEQISVLLAIPYLVKRSTYCENVIKIRQPNGLWLSTETSESLFDSYKDKHFVQCRVHQSASCAVVSRLKRDTILVSKQSSGRFQSTADPRLTVQWPVDVSQIDLRLNLRVQPVESSAFTEFCKTFSHECQGLLAVGPLIDLNADDIPLLKPMYWTIPMVVPNSKNLTVSKSTNAESNDLQQTGSQPSPSDSIFQQQSIFKAILGEDSSNERLMLLYCMTNENTWHVDGHARLTESKTPGLIAVHLNHLPSRMILVRCDRQLMPTKNLSSAICQLERALKQRAVTLVLRHRETNTNEICLVCCSSKRFGAIDRELQREEYGSDDEQCKEIILREGQLLELRFRGNVLPKDAARKPNPFAFNTYYPFYFETNVAEIDTYSQHIAPQFYGFAQIFSKQKVLSTISKDMDKKKQHAEPKQDWHETEICLAELVIRLPKDTDETPTPISKTPVTLTGDGILTPAVFRDIASGLSSNERRRLAYRLGITQVRIEAIEHSDPADASYQILLAWYKRVSRSADNVAILMQALRSVHRSDLVQMLQSAKDERRRGQQLSAKDDRLRLFRVPFNRICQRDECVRTWKHLADRLDLAEETIEQIENGYLSRQERCLGSLEYWAKHDERADILRLIRILRSAGFKSVAGEIENMV